MDLSTSLSENKVLRDCKQALDLLKMKGILDYWRISTVGIPTSDGFRPNNDMLGFSDILVLMKGLPIFIEVKSSKGKQTENQKEFQARVEDNGGHYALVRSRDEMLTIIDAFTTR